MVDCGYPDDGWVHEDRVEELMRLCAAQMREMLARFVENGGDAPCKVIAQSMRANWIPGWGEDPGHPKEIIDDIWQL